MGNLDKKRPFFTMDSRLKDIPRDWLVDVEPKIVRTARFKECWIWEGGCDTYGHPTFWVTSPETGRQTTVRVARFIAKMFWPGLKRHHDVAHSCGNIACLNPAHLSPRIAHWQHDLDRQEMAADAPTIKPRSRTPRKS